MFVFVIRLKHLFWWLQVVAIRIVRDVCRSSKQKRE